MEIVGAGAPLGSWRAPATRRKRTWIDHTCTEARQTADPGFRFRVFTASTSLPEKRRQMGSDCDNHRSLITSRPLVSALVAGLALSTAWGASLAAQEEADWDVEAEAGASLYFGNTSQTTVNTRLSSSRTDSTYDFSTQSSFAYGEAEDDTGEAFVVKRAWDVGASLDWHPYARLSPFAFGRGESSFERRIDFRYNLGGGGKYTFVRTEESRLDLSLALLAEQTFASEGLPPDADVDESVLARWSLRFRGDRELSEGRVVLSTENFYKPVFGEYDNYVFESRSSISFALSEIISTKLSFLDTYDSRAVDRGAETNNDGQLLLSLLARL